MFENETLGEDEADLVYTVLFQGLWCLADRAGRLKDRPNWIRSKIFPYRTVPNPNDLLQWLADKGFIQRYSVDGERYIQVLEFLTYQKPHNEEAESVIPPPDSARVVIPTDGDTNVHLEGERPQQPPRSCTCSSSCSCSGARPSWTDRVAGVRACEAYAAVDPKIVEIGVIKTLITHRNLPDPKPIRDLSAYCREEIETLVASAPKGNGLNAMLHSMRQKAEKFLT